MENLFFIIGCARSGTTACAKILSISTNSKVFVEQQPKLCKEARDQYKKKITNPIKTIKNAKEYYIKSVTEKGLIYGDKNPNYLLFVPYMEELWKPKFIFLVRDGRDVVRSMMDWHDICGGNIYGMKEDEECSDIVSFDQDWWDYSRLRPNGGEPYYAEWKNLSRFEKCSWYWNEFNTQMFKHVSSLDKKRWRLININTVKVSDFEKIFNFLGLNGFNPEKIDKMITARINSPMDRTNMSNKFPNWRSWSDEQNKIFNKHAEKMMLTLGY